MPRRRRGKKVEEGDADSAAAESIDSADPTEVTSVEDIISKLNKKHGSSITTLSDPALSIHIPGVLSTGSESVDLAIGRGGIPLGRFTIVAGNEGSGKTSLALHTCASCQRAGGIAVYVDAEYKLDRDYAAALGVDIDRLIVVQPETLEDCYAKISDLIDEFEAHRASVECPMLIVIDSLSAMQPQSEIVGNSGLGAHARVVSPWFRNTVRRMSHQKIAVLLISQLRKKIGVMHGDDDTTSGGSAPRFYSSVIIKLMANSAITEDGVKVGNNVSVKISKNQIAAPFREAKIVIRFGEGIDYVHSICHAFKTADVAVTKGSWTSVIGEDGEALAKWQGDAGFRRLYLAEDPTIMATVAAFRSRYGWG